MRSKAGMANRQGDVDLRFAQVSAPVRTLAWLGLVHLTLYNLPLKMELIQGSETSANYNLTPGKYPKENIQYSIHGESLKSRGIPKCFINLKVLPEAGNL